MKVQIPQKGREYAGADPRAIGWFSALHMGMNCYGITILLGLSTL